MPSALDLSADVAVLTARLVDVPSVSGNEAALAGLVHDALAPLPRLRVRREDNVVLARTELGRAQRVVLAGHLDTVPLAGNVPSRTDGDLLFGCGTTDMKSGDAVALRAAYLVGIGALEPTMDVTWAFYDCEEVDSERNGLRRLAVRDPGALAADLAVLLEPTDGLVEGGCQGTLRVEIEVPGVRAHSARSWTGRNAIHDAADVLTRLGAYEPRQPIVDGLTYHEGLNAVGISGGVAGNVIPDRCVVTVNHRFAPDRGVDQALAHVGEVFAGFDVRLVDSAPAARPGLNSPLARSFSVAAGGEARAKLGWTDVARFDALGIPALNYGPGDPSLAHTVGEHVRMSGIRCAERCVLAFLTTSTGS